ncbi:MAG: tRNA(Ile)(2)-agmatinylcytidine synthase [Candidatus Thorarchaeota archaeon]|nr:tRNA(Ile)(2)-agmatinylcytidine synthase [Candidatus Thorarchaeota archaeon]
MSQEFHLGLDDVDSPRGGCTTHFASILIERLSEWPLEWLDYPNLIRLNPNIPYRTRGNGALALRFRTDRSVAEDVVELVTKMIPEYIERDYPNTNPGAVLIAGEPPDAVVRLSEIALWRVLSLEVTKQTLQKLGAWHYTSGNGRGLIGALAAIGNRLMGDHTYEYITYRNIRETTEERGVDHESVFEMNRAMGDRTFSNVDLNEHTILIEPHGPDPVLYGIRGDRPEDLIEAASMVKTRQRIDRWTIFRTNQGTGQHLEHRVRILDLRPYMSAIVRGTVTAPGRMREGGHLFFSIQDETNTKIECAVYEPTRQFREIMSQLIEGDLVDIMAGVRPASRTHGMTLNVEGMRVINLATKQRLVNPLCPECGKRMKSAGHEKGFKCPRCGFRLRERKKIAIVEERDLRQGVYLPPPRAQRHLTRPYSRLDRINERPIWPPNITWYQP